jgi:hypothetical protein
MELETYRKLCLKQQSELRKLMTGAGNHQQAIALFLEQHAMLHSAKIAQTDSWSLEDAILDGMPDEQLRRIPRNCEHSVLWCLWHIARIEDVAMNMLVARGPQVLNRENWLERMNLSVQHTGNTMDEAAVADLSSSININALRAYRVTVGRRTREIVKALQPEDLKHKVEPARIKQVMEEGAVIEQARGIANYWSKRDIAGLLLMPASRHLIVHLNEALNLKRRRHEKVQTQFGSVYLRY